MRNRLFLSIFYLIIASVLILSGSASGYEVNKNAIATKQGKPLGLDRVL